MAGVLTLPDGATRYLKHVKTREIVTEYDWEAFRPPFGSRPQVAGDGSELPGSITITVEVYDQSDFAELKHNGELVTIQGEPIWVPVRPGLAQLMFNGELVTLDGKPIWVATGAPSVQLAAELLDRLIVDAQAARTLLTPLGYWQLKGLQDVHERNRGAGFQVDFTWATDGYRAVTSRVTADGIRRVTTDGKPRIALERLGMWQEGGN